LRLKSATVKADLFHAFSNLLSTGVVFVGLLLSSLGIYVGDIGAAVILGCSLSVANERTIRLCRDHYKIWKKETKSIRETERARYG